MTYIKNGLRPGATAIAAVLAFSTTPLLAQPAETAAPPVVTLPTPAPPTRAPVATLPTPAAPVMRSTAPEPVAAAPEPRAERTTTTRTRTTTTARAEAPRAAAPVTRSPDPAPIAAPEPIPAETGASLSEAPIAPMPAEPVAAPGEPVADDGNLLPIAGGAAGLLLLAGGAYALSRRRRVDEGEAYEISETWEQDHVAHAEPVVAAERTFRAPEPVMAREDMAATAAPAMAAAALPEDLASYGRHTQAAYRGPTPDNPSLSLKRRLKRAAFFDQREQMGAEAAAAPMPVAAKVEAPETAPAPRREQTITSRRISPKASTQALFGGFKPAFQN